MACNVVVIKVIKNWSFHCREERYAVCVLTVAAASASAMPDKQLAFNQIHEFKKNIWIRLECAVRKSTVLTCYIIVIVFWPFLNLSRIFYRYMEKTIKKEDESMHRRE